MTLYITLNGDKIKTDYSYIIENYKMFGNEDDLYSLKAYTNDINGNIGRVVLERDLPFGQALISINRVFSTRIEVWNQTTNEAVIVSMADKNKRNTRVRKQYNTKSFVHEPIEMYVPKFIEDAPKRVSYISYK